MAIVISMMKVAPSDQVAIAKPVNAVISVKYEGYVRRQFEMAEKLRKFESRKIPSGFDYAPIPGLSREVVQKLSEVQPETIGQASRIPGLTPAAIAVLLVAVDRHWKAAANS